MRCDYNNKFSTRNGYNYRYYILSMIMFIYIYSAIIVFDMPTPSPQVGSKLTTNLLNILAFLELLQM